MSFACDEFIVNEAVNFTSKMLPGQYELRGQKVDGQKVRGESIDAVPAHAMAFGEFDGVVNRHGHRVRGLHGISFVNDPDHSATREVNRAPAVSRAQVDVHTQSITGVGERVIDLFERRSATPGDVTCLRDQLPCEFGIAADPYNRPHGHGARVEGCKRRHFAGVRNKRPFSLQQCQVVWFVKCHHITRNRLSSARAGDRQFCQDFAPGAFSRHPFAASTTCQLVIR